jgi:hypothetical protein
VLRISTSNPLLLIREFGGTIRAKRSDFLFIRSKDRSKIIAKKKQITVRPVLGFRRTFRGFRSEGVRILQRGVDNMSRRGQLKLEGR